MQFLEKELEQLHLLFESDFNTFKNMKFDDDLLYEFYIRNKDFAKDILRNKKIDSDFIEMIMPDAPNDILFWIAMKNCLTENQLAILSKSEDESVRHRVVYNKHTPEYLLNILSHDEQDFVAKDAKLKLEELSRK